MMSFPIQLALVRADTQSIQLPRLRDFVQRIEARPAYQRAVVKGGPLGVTG